MLAQKNRHLQKTNRMLTHLKQDVQVLEEVVLKAFELELLKSALHQIPKNSTHITTINYFSETLEPYTLVLDPHLTPKEYLEKRFKGLQKAKRGIPILLDRIKQYEALKATLEQEIQTLLNDPHAVVTPEQKPPVSLLKNTPKRLKNEAIPFRLFTSLDGWPIWVGKSKKDNDRLSFLFSKGNDYWLHVRSYAGSHVVIPHQKEKPLPQETLLDAASLAVYFSRARGEKVCEVSFTHIKHLKRIKGQPGLVRVSQERILPIRVELERLKRLLQVDP